MRGLSDKQVMHLLEVVDRPDFSGTQYRLLEVIGRGGMGTVYRAEDAHLSRQVAIKVLNTADHFEVMNQRMHREAAIIAQLEHPAIIPVHDAGSLPDGRAYYVMKLVRGRRLDHLLADSVTLNERLRLFRTVCEAVAFAHAHGVVHRDLKPANIMVGPFGEVLVMDWGIAKVLGTTDQPSPLEQPLMNQSVTAHGTVLGTPSYMSPEQARGDVEMIDQRTDVYSLGSILFYLLARKPPPALVETAAPASPRHYDRSLPRRLDAICAKALAPDRSDRYADAQSLAAEIDRYLDGKPITAYRDNPVELAMRWVDRHRFIVVLVLAYILMRVVLLLATNR